MEIRSWWMMLVVLSYQALCRFKNRFRRARGAFKNTRITFSPEFSHNSSNLRSLLSPLGSSSQILHDPKPPMPESPIFNSSRNFWVLGKFRFKPEPQRKHQNIFPQPMQLNRQHQKYSKQQIICRN
ncbi:hypothetical protein PIB30_043154 [Stylosanthes scabra]|uniref:Uncharacterized protein n=1 Tax=Stylosanthes scabra TaxID=79078 RepID=A0ABU6ZE67_9FABA|nr:hypothetical protein [Stylosanthes scabra]